MKTISITGRLTRDAEQKDTFVRFAVAVNGWENGASKTEFFDVTLFGKRGQTAAQYLKKGGEVSVSGDFSTFQADSGKTYCKIKTNDVTLCGGGKRSDDAPARPVRDEHVPATTYDDEIPF